MQTSVVRVIAVLAWKAVAFTVFQSVWCDEPSQCSVSTQIMFEERLNLTVVIAAALAYAPQRKPNAQYTVGI